MIALGISELGAQESKARHRVYVSGAERKELIVLELDVASGAVQEVGRVTTPGEPGALALSADGRTLFVALRAEGRLTSFRVPEDGSLPTLISDVEAGEDPAHVAIDPSGRYLLTAYYVAGKVSVHAIDQEGALSVRPVAERPTAPRAHAVVFDRSGQHLYVPHTGSERIDHFQWEAARGRLIADEAGRVVTPPGTGPRHAVADPDHPLLWVDDEQGSSVTAYRIDNQGHLERRAQVSTLPQDFEASNATAEIRRHPQGRYLYVANRGHDSLAIIAIDAQQVAESSTPQDGLQAVGFVPTEATPRSFDISPDGRWVLVAGEASGNLAVYQVTAAGAALQLKEQIELGPRLWWVLVAP